MLQRDHDDVLEYKLEVSISSLGDSSLSPAAPTLKSGTNKSFVYRINRVQPLTTTPNEKYAKFVLRPSQECEPTVPCIYARQAHLTPYVAFDHELLHPIPSDRTDSEATYARLAEWLSRYRSSHKECNTNRNSQLWFPTRLLDFADGKSLVRLVDSRLHTLAGCYVILSHRRGSAR